MIVIKVERFVQLFYLAKIVVLWIILSVKKIILKLGVGEEGCIDFLKDFVIL